MGLIVRLRVTPLDMRRRTDGASGGLGASTGLRCRASTMDRAGLASE